MTTTAKNVTEKQIRALRAEALARHDYDLAAVCDLALEGADVDDYSCLTVEGARRLRSMTCEQAIDHCARAVDESEALA